MESNLQLLAGRGGVYEEPMVVVYDTLLYSLIENFKQSSFNCSMCLTHI